MTAKGNVQTEQIVFKNFMAPFDRTDTGCFLKAKFLSPSDVLQPIADLETINPPTAYEDADNVQIVTGDGACFVIGRDVGGTNGLITEIDEVTSSATVRVTNSALKEIDSQCAVYYPTQGYISIIDDQGGYHTFNPGTYSFSANVDNEGSGDPSIVLHKADDIVYWVVDNAIHSDNAGTITNNLVSLPGGIGRNILLEYSSYLVCLTYFRNNQDIRAYFWDRDASNPFFDRNPLVANGRLMGAGVVEGVMTIAVFEYTPDNRDYLGRINVYQYLGGDTFKRRSWLPVKNSSYVSVDNPFHCDGQYLYLATRPEDKAGYPNAGYYRIDSQGRIVVENVHTSANRFMAMGRAPEWNNEMITVWREDNDTVTFARQAVLDKTDSDDGHFTIRSSYITKMLGQPDVRKKLVHFDLAFETFNATFDQEIEVYYRTHPDGTWSQLKEDINYDANKDNNCRRLISASGDATNKFPTYKEIQFRIDSNSGAVITKASYAYRSIDNKPNTTK